jgi:hypothetical protein
LTHLIEILFSPSLRTSHGGPLSSFSLWAFQREQYRRGLLQPVCFREPGCRAGTPRACYERARSVPNKLGQVGPDIGKDSRVHWLFRDPDEVPGAQVTFRRQARQRT